MGLTGLDWLENRFIHQAGGVMEENKLTMGHQHVLTAKKVTNLLGCVRLSVARRSKERICSSAQPWWNTAGAGSRLVSPV